MTWPFKRKPIEERFDMPAAPDDDIDRRKELVQAGKRLKAAEDLRDRYTRRIAETYVAGGLTS